MWDWLDVQGSMATWMTNCTGVDGQPACCDSNYVSMYTAVGVLKGIFYVCANLGATMLGRFLG